MDGVAQPPVAALAATRVRSGTLPSHWRTLPQWRGSPVCGFLHETEPIELAQSLIPSAAAAPPRDWEYR
jgi:hypothetical protein